MAPGFDRCANRGAIPEIVGDAAILADPLSASDIDRDGAHPRRVGLVRQDVSGHVVAQTKAFFEQALGGVGA